MSNRDSGSKNIPHQILSKIDKIKNDLLKAQKDWNSKQLELIDKQKEIVANIAALESTISQMAAFTATELGKFQAFVEAEQMKNDRIFYKMDINILALAEIQKTLFSQTALAIAHLEKANISLSDDEKEKCLKVAEECRQTITTAAFSTVRQRMEEEEKKMEEEAAKREKERQDLQEKENLKQLLKTSDSKSLIVPGQSSGSEFPEGAEFFGG